jgi:hypothetical protein
VDGGRRRNLGKIFSQALLTNVNIYSSLVRIHKNESIDCGKKGAREGKNEMFALNETFIWGKTLLNQLRELSGNCGGN